MIPLLYPYLLARFLVGGKSADLFEFCPAGPSAFPRDCIDECERLMVSMVSLHIPDHLWALQQISSGNLILNRTVVDAVCSGYWGTRVCSYDCAKTEQDRREIYLRNAMYEKMCIRKHWQVVKQVPCMERVQNIIDPTCCQKCQHFYGGCGDRLKLMFYARKLVQNVNERSTREELYSLSKTLHRLCGLTHCQVECKEHQILRYCTPEALFLLLEFAGAPFVPMGKRMRQMKAFDYWPDNCRHLAYSSTAPLQISPLLAGLVILLQFYPVVIKQ